MFDIHTKSLDGVTQQTTIGAIVTGLLGRRVDAVVQRDASVHYNGAGKSHVRTMAWGGFGECAAPLRCGVSGGDCERSSSRRR